MKINEVEQLNEGVGDWMRAAAYNTLGIGGQKGNAAANMYHFRDGFTQQYKQSVNAAKESGLPMDYSRFIDSYMGRYGWTVNKKQKRALMGLVNDPKKLSKAMYAVGMSQERDPQGYMMGKNQGVGSPAGVQGKQAGSGMSKQQLMKALQQAQAELKKVQSGPQLSSISQKIISDIQQLAGPENLDDLAAVAKTAMQMLYAQNKDKYNELYKEITTGQKANQSPEEQIAAKRVEKLKAAAKAADAEASPFSKLPGSEPAQAASQPRTPEEFAARRIAKQKAAMAALNGGGSAPAASAPTAMPTAQPTKSDTVTAAPSTKPMTAPVRGANGQALPTTPSMNPIQVPGARTTLNPQTSKPARKVPSKV